MSGTGDDRLVEVGDDLLGPGLGEFEVVAEVGEEPPEAVELTELSRYLANGSG